MTRIDQELAGSAGAKWHGVRSRLGSRRRMVVAIAAAMAAAAVLTFAVANGRQIVRDMRSSPSTAAAPSAAASTPSVAATRTPTPIDVRTITSAMVAAKVRTALSGIHTLRAESTSYFKVVKGPPKSQWQDDWTTADWWARAHILSDEEFDSWNTENTSPCFPTKHIVVSADGRWRVDSPESEGSPVIVDVSAGNEVTGAKKVLWPGMALHAGRNASLGAPDVPGDFWGAGIDLYLRFIQPSALEAMAGGKVRKTTYDGRPALTVTCPIAPIPIKGLVWDDMDSHLWDAIRFTVDRKTWLIVRSSRMLRGQVVWDDRLTNVRVNGPISDAEFDVSCPVGTKVKEKNLGFRRVTFSEAASRFSTRPCEPRALPSEFSPFAASVAPRATFSYFTYTEGYGDHYWPPSRDVTQLSYRAGLLRFVVTTRSQPAADEPMPADPMVADPFVRELAANDPASTGSVEKVELTGGAWRGVTAYLVTPVDEAPHLWAWNDGTMVTISGDLTHVQLLDVANSLEPME